MEQKIKLILFIKIFLFVFSFWICHLNSDLRRFEGFFNEKYMVYRKLHTGTYRFLANCKNNIEKSITGLKEDVTNYGRKEKKYIYNTQKGTNAKNKHSHGLLSEHASAYRKAMKNKSCIFETKKYSHLEKKIFKELDYQNFLEKNKIISDRLCKKIIRKKYGLRFVIPSLLFFLLSLGLILDLSVDYGLLRGFYYIMSLICSKDWAKNLRNLLKHESVSAFFQPMEQITGSNGKHYYIYTPGFFGTLIYFTSFFILGVTIISGIIYYHKKVKKYEKIKFKKR
ncbi:fam-l protein [Plasmodium malariae]|uniref:Fam-l protein n=1 Tax=Plasmodium malariae TaxID=5858 RepID=A0A1D3JIG6_PLAMA|nr:fam-l protein [Plasmodium malariae]SBT86143.1 fam-l protein [Plasmodium malariae]